MPQFDFFIWFSLSFTTIFIFQISCLLIKYLIVARVARIQKTLIKLYLKKKQKQKILINFLDNSFNFYFLKLKLKQNLQSNLNKVISKDKNFFFKKNLSLKNINFKKSNTFIKKYYKIKIKKKLELIPIKSNITKIQIKEAKKKITKNIKQIPIELITENVIKKETIKSNKDTNKNSKKKKKNMNSFLKLYSSEGFLIFSSISLLIFNSLFAYNIKFKFPILNFEIFHQILTILLLTFLILSNMNIVSINYDFFFFNTIATQNLKLLLLFIFLMFFCLIWKSFIIQKLNFFEYFIILIIILTGLFFLISSYNLLSIYLCLEIQALGFYILASFNRTSIFSTESGLKYFISSSIISGLFLLGSAFIYGSLGTINLFEIEFLIINFFTYSFNFSFFFFGIFLILVALLFKLVIAPFHFWFPQIYDGAPLSSTIIFSTYPKIALINLFINFWVSILNIIPFLKTIFFLLDFIV